MFVLICSSTPLVSLSSTLYGLVIEKALQNEPPQKKNSELQPNHNVRTANRTKTVPKLK
jgi:hypothetical protein